MKHPSFAIGQHSPGDHPLSRMQRGGTLLGFCVGLLLGLALSLLVALYVTRVQAPFVARDVTRDPAQDVKETERNIGWNPNAALGTGAPVAPLSTVPASAAPATLPAPLATPAPAAPTAAADPLGDLARTQLDQARASAASAANDAPERAATTARPVIFYVQAGAFANPEEAQTQRAKLVLMGQNASISEREQAGRTVHRVRLGPFDQQAAAEAVRDQLQAQGLDATLVHVQR